METSRLTAVVLTGATALVLTIPGASAQSTGPVARYDMRAGTVTGASPMSGASAMSMIFGGGAKNTAQHELYLRLGSSQGPAKGAPKADHFMPPNARLGKSVALETPREDPVPDALPQRPKGRLLIFWGCGEHVGKGQPVVIDFAKIAAGQVPPDLWNSTVLRDWGPTLANSKTFGRWPSGDGKSVRGDSSLPGLHRIAGNYSPEISFTLTKDFMAPLAVQTADLPGGATRANWGGIPDVTGYLLGLFGGKQDANGEMGEMIMWSSSASRQFGNGLSDWLSPSQVAALVKDGTVLAPTVTSCTIPAEVNKAAGDFRFGSLTAFGPEEDFAYPPRPADPKAAWNLEWTARIRHRSTTSWMQMEGMATGMGSAMADEPQAQPKPECKKKKKGLGGALGGVLSGALGTGDGC